MHGCSAYHGRYGAILEGYAISAEQVRADHVYLGEEEGAVLGFYSLCIDASAAELDLMFVADQAQGQGVGAALFQHMRALSASLACTSVAIVSHPPAQAFYQRMGAERVGTKLPSGRVSWERPVLALRIAEVPRA
jgi:GNAT superfamily N-acetyltransferase